MHRFFVTAFFVLCSISFSFAQQAGLHLGVTIPMNEFKDNLDRIGVGGSVDLLLFRTGPVHTGLNLGFFNYGSETRSERFSTTIPDVLVDVTRSNNIFNFHFMFQVAPNLSTVVPYAEALFGGAYFWTDTKIDSDVDEVASTTNFDDFAWSYGAGGGLMIHLYTDPENIQMSELMLDLKVRYLFGSEAEYLKEGSVYIQNGNAYYSAAKSKTDMMTVTAGVTFKFNSIL